MLRGKKLEMKEIMDSRTAARCKISSRLGFRKYDVIWNKEQPMLGKLRRSFEGENMKTRLYVLGYWINLFFCGQKVTIEIDKNCLSDINHDYEIKR